MPIYSVSKFTERLVNGHPVAVPVIPEIDGASSPSTSSSSCDTGAPNDGSSCHGWWAADTAEFQDWCPYGDCPDFEIYWKVVFWTDAGNNTVTNFQTVYCEDRPSWMDVETPCQTGHETAPGYELHWTANWWYVATYCPASYSEHTHVYATATVNADHKVAGVKYDDGKARFCQ